MPPVTYNARKKNRPLTAEQLFAMKDQFDACSHELDYGMLMLREPAGFEHGDIAIELTVRLRIYVKQHHLGRVVASDVGFVLTRNPDTVLAPDVAFVRADRIPYRGLPKGYFEGAPDLVVEVVSPSDRFSMVEQKIEKYLQAGARLVWVISPQDHTAVVRRADGSVAKLRAHDSFDGEDVVPGFSCRLGDLFTM